MNEQYVTLVGKVCAPRYEEVYTPEVKSKLPIEASSEGRKLKDYTIYGNNNPNHVDESQSILPISIDTYGGNATDWEIYGNNNPVVENKTSTLPIDASATAGNLLDYTIYGNNSCNKNLLEITAESQTINGVTFMVDKQAGTITANGTATANARIEIGTIDIIANERYNLSGNIKTPSESANRICSLYVYTHSDLGVDYGDGVVLEPVETDIPGAKIAFMVYKDKTVENAIIRPMFRLADTTPVFEPYQIGVGEKTTQLFTDTVGKKVITAAADTILFTGISNPMTLAAGRYTIHYYQSTSMMSNTRNTLSVFTVATGVQIYESSATNHNLDAGWYSWTFDIPNDGSYQMRIWIANASDEVKATNFILTKGETATPTEYIPYGYQIPIAVSQRPIYPIQRELKGKSVRDQITTTKGNETLTWDIIGIDHDECYYPDGTRAQHTATIQLHDCFTSLQFDEREALFYAESAMPAGTYHFTLREQPWYAADVNKTFKFTLTQALAAGSQICVTNAYNATMTSGKIKTFSDGSSTTAIETVDITEGSDGTDLGDVRNALVGQNTNSIQRALLGSNNWANSAMRQWLNSSAVAGSVWTPKTKFDRPPSWVSSIAGFLNGMDEDFVKAVGTVKKTTALNTVTDGGGKVESDERFFLLSRSEVYGENEVAGGEGAAYSYYADYSDLSGAGTGADTNRIKYRNNAVQYWWLRSPRVPYALSVRGVNTTGSVITDFAISSHGVAPACCILLDEVYNSHEYDIYIGDSPLTEGETVSKTSTGVDIELFNGDNIIDTTLANKPQVDLTYRSSVLGVGEAVWIHGLSAPLRAIGDVKDTLDLSIGTLTRRIKKIVLTGTISDGSTGITAQGIIYITPISTLRNIRIAYCTHYQNVEQSQSGNMPSNSFTTTGGAGSSLWFKTDYTTIADFQSYLAAQYAAGTPVTVWYVLAEPKASTIPVPSGLTGTIEGYLIQDGTPTPETPIYPTANGEEDTGGTYKVFYSYQIPLLVTSGQQSTPHTIYIGSAPLTEGQSVSKTSTGTEIALYQGENTISTTLGNKPETRIDYLSTEVGVGERTKNFVRAIVGVTSSGVTYTVDSVAGTVTANGTATGTAQIRIAINYPDEPNNTTVPPGNYYFSGCPSGGSGNSYNCYSWDYDTAARSKQWDGTTNVETDLGQGNCQVQINGHRQSIILRIAPGYTANNVVFKPMLRKADATSDFEPYGYQLPIDIKQGDEVVDHKDIYIGTQPLVEGASVSKVSVGEDITLANGNNYIDTDLFNKPEMYIK